MKKLSITLSALLIAAGMTTGCASKRAVAKDEPRDDLSTASKPAAQKTVQISAAKENAAPLPGFDGATLYFEFDSSQLTAESTGVLQSLADVMRKNSAVRVNIAGHCDERGTTEFNLALGNSRAEVAKRYLVNLGVEESRVSTISYGEESPAQHGNDEAAWAANRRDVIAPR